MKGAKAGTGLPVMGGVDRKSLFGTILGAGAFFVLAVAGLATAHLREGAGTSASGAALMRKLHRLAGGGTAAMFCGEC
ncbi:hypothetical protein [Erythrobacter sp.]|jgi:hypothetical protein|uniref:hypothetical protein n=1 Tax=Erythrobacter sp. TaxID=1042 RepID=UPI002EAC89E4|nr:hypothetical protein [Erythrobacter sp.]